MTGHHAERVRLLDALAVLRGYTHSLESALPDGRYPDVVRYAPPMRGLFIGDAKHTETAGNVQTRVRLWRYLAWFATHAHRGGGGVFAVCFADRGDVARWRGCLANLAREAGLASKEVRTTRFGRATAVAWIEVGTSSVLMACPRPTRIPMTGNFDSM